ncbi:MAG: hypothetical protein F6J93_15190 [Oscillatoria sp. SIO1A7]|nr:hypothetical protein [Oscillatoria sp. SIO1A7]
MVNSQVTDAVTQTNVTVLGESPSQSMGLVYQSMAQSISLLMQNGVSTQGGMQQINAAVIATACREIMAGPQPAPPRPAPAPEQAPQGNVVIDYRGDTTIAELVAPAPGASTGTSPEPKEELGVKTSEDVEIT